MTYEQAFDIFQKQYGIVTQLWSFYSTVALALLAAVVGSERLKASRLGIWALILGFWIFSIANLNSVVRSQQLAFNLGAVANTVAQADPLLRNNHVVIDMPTGAAVQCFHLACDVLLTTAILVVSNQVWRRQRKGTEKGSQVNPGTTA